MHELRTGVLLINLGSPEAPTVVAVRRFLREFLGDPRVLDMPAPLRWLLLNAVILPFRPRRSAQAYQQIWLPQGAPLLVHGHALREAVGEALGSSYVVALGMRYGSPSIRQGLQRLCALDVARILVLPLFPQYSSATTGSVVEKVEEEMDRRPEIPPIEVLPAFYAEPRFIAAWTEVARPELEAFRPDFVLFSYHGLPERQLKAADPSGEHCLAQPGCCESVAETNRDCYRAQCFATTRALAPELGLAPEQCATAFQSRLGRTPWIGPHTDLLLPELAAAGHRRLAVLCPAFVADCLETLEEIGIRARQRWRELGAEELRLVPSLNASPAWVEAVAQWARARA
jgi:ferrochelatase